MSFIPLRLGLVSMYDSVHDSERRASYKRESYCYALVDAHSSLVMGKEATNPLDHPGNCGKTRGAS